MTDPNVTIRTPRDPNTLSNYHNFLTRHTVAEFEIDFEKKVLNGGVELTFESLTDGEAKDVVLDTRLVFPFHDLKGSIVKAAPTFYNTNIFVQLPGHQGCQA